MKKLLLSSGFALKGLAVFFRTQRNARIQFVILLFVFVLGLFLRLNAREWVEIVFAAGLVFVAELFNTAVEFLTDLVSPEFNKQAGKVKDVAAGAVLLAAFVAVIIGALVFLPRLI
jgi:diacylglycerol kinase